jgi:hypothetical protein
VLQFWEEQWSAQAGVEHHQMLKPLQQYVT